MTSSRVFADSNLDPRFRAGLVGHWIGGGSGLTWFDRSGSGNHGALVSGPAWTIGHGGYQPALAFDGATNYVQLGTIEGLASLTITCWVRRTSGHGSENQRIFMCGALSTGFGLYFRATNRVEFGRPGLSGIQATSGAITDTNWHHVALSYDGAIASFYVDGMSAGALAYVETFSADTYRVASAAYGGFFNGEYEDVRIYNRALSSAEIAAIASPSYSPIIGGGLTCGL